MLCAFHLFTYLCEVHWASFFSSMIHTNYGFCLLTFYTIPSTSCRFLLFPLSTLFSFVFLHCFPDLSFLFFFLTSLSLFTKTPKSWPSPKTFVPRYCYFPVCWLCCCCSRVLASQLFCEGERLLQVSTNQMEKGWHEQNVKSSLVASGEILHSTLTNCRGFKECMIGQANGLAFSKVIHQNIFLPFRKAGYLDNNYENCAFAQLYSVICFTCKMLHWGSQLIKS